MPRRRARQLERNTHTHIYNTRSKGRLPDREPSPEATPSPSLVNHMASIPTEIFSLIIAKAVAMDCEYRPGPPPEKPLFALRTFCNARLVCRAWNDALVEDSYFWSEIILLTPESLPKAQLALSRCKDRQINLMFGSLKYSATMEIDTWLMENIEFAKLCLPRCRELSIDLHANLMHAVLPLWSQTPAPFLRHLTLRDPFDGHQHTPFFFHFVATTEEMILDVLKNNFNGDIKHVQKLTMDHLHLSWYSAEENPFPALEVLKMTLQPTPRRDFGKMLLATPTLKQVSIDTQSERQAVPLNTLLELGDLRSVHLRGFNFTLEPPSRATSNLRSIDLMMRLDTSTISNLDHLLDFLEVAEQLQTVRLLFYGRSLERRVSNHRKRKGLQNVRRLTLVSPGDFALYCLASFSFPKMIYLDIRDDLSIPVTTSQDTAVVSEIECMPALDTLKLCVPLTHDTLALLLSMAPAVRVFYSHVEKNPEFLLKLIPFHLKRFPEFRRCRSCAGRTRVHAILGITTPEPGH